MIWQAHQETECFVERLTELGLTVSIIDGSSRRRQRFTEHVLKPVLGRQRVTEPLTGFRTLFRPN